MKKYNRKTILLIIVWIVVIWIVIGILISPKQNIKNTILINGHFDHVEKGIGTGRSSGSIWYDLYIQESRNYYRISADNSPCFLFDNLRNQVKIGNPIQLYINKPPLFFSIAKPMVVSVIANNEKYLSFDCINSEIENERVEYPLYCLVIGLLVTLLIYKKAIRLS